MYIPLLPNAETPSTGRTGKRIDDWKQKLVDLTRRNRLLFFKATKSSTLKLVEPGFNEVFARLIGDEKAWQFFLPPDDSNDDDLPSVEAAQEESLANALTVISLDQARELRNSNELICNIRDPKCLRSILRNLYRRSKSDFEERGVRILYLAFGILEWQEVQDTEYSESPLLLVPVQITRATVNDPYILKFADEDIVINPALEVKLKSDFSIELPVPPDDWEEASLSDYLTAVADIASKKDWHVRQECWLGLFSFHKLVMYQDLHSHGDLISNNEMMFPLLHGQ